VKQPLVTVLMPNHNGGRFIGKAIESVLRQTMADFELLIIEDASTDNSKEEIAKFSDERIRVIEFAQNEHICIGLNTGIAQARGKYIARLDSDDCWYPDKLKKQIGYMQKNPQCGASFTWVNVVDEEDRTLSAQESMFVDLFHSPNRSRAQWLHDFYSCGCLVCHPSAVFPKEVALEVGGYRNSLVQLQDYDLWIRIVKKYPIYVLEEKLMDYRHALLGGNVSAKTTGNTIRSYFETADVLGTFFDGVSDEMFIEAFSDDFVRPGTRRHEDLLCEKALLMIQPGFWGHAARPAGMKMLANLLDNEETRLVLRNTYGVTQMNYYHLETLPILEMEDPAFIAESIPGRQMVKILIKKLLRRYPRVYNAAAKCYGLIRR